MFVLLSALAFDLDQSKILLFGKEVTEWLHPFSDDSFYTPVEDGTYYGITRGGRAPSSSLSGAYLQNYTS